MELRVNEVAIPEKIDFNYEELKAELISKVSFYETLVYTDDQIKAQMLAHADKYSQAFYKDAGKVKTKYGEKQRVSFADYEAGNYDPRDSWMYSSFWYKNFDGMHRHIKLALRLITGSQTGL